MPALFSFALCEYADWRERLPRRDRRKIVWTVAPNLILVEEEYGVDVAFSSTVPKALRNLQVGISFNSKYDTLTRIATFCSEKITDFEKMLSDLSLKCRVIDKFQDQNKQLIREIEKLKDGPHQFEQHNRLRNLGIQDVPQKDIENLYDILGGISKSIQCPICVA